MGKSPYRRVASSEGFAKNRKHAWFLKDMFLELDKERFGNDL